MRVPIFGAPMFLVSSPELIIAQCLAGVVGILPALNLRPTSALDNCLTQIKNSLASFAKKDGGRVWQTAPFGVNLMVHPSNARLKDDLAVITSHEVPVVVTSLSSPERVVPHIHAYGGMVFHDVASVKHARRAVAAGADGLVLVCAGAGGHTGRLSPFAFVSEVRRFFDGPIAVSGCITDGGHLLVLQTMGANFGYVGTRFITSVEANAADRYKQMIVASAADDIISSTAVTGLTGNYLVKSFEALGIDASKLERRETSTFSLGMREDGTTAKAWRDVWSAGQGVGAISDIEPVEVIVARFAEEYSTAVRNQISKLCDVSIS
nr:nitronate monooxygenase family protein [Paraburkholderia caribensis]